MTPVNNSSMCSFRAVRIFRSGTRAADYTVVWLVDVGPGLHTLDACRSWGYVITPSCRVVLLVLKIFLSVSRTVDLALLSEGNEYQT